MVDFTDPLLFPSKRDLLNLRCKNEQCDILTMNLFLRLVEKHEMSQEKACRSFYPSLAFIQGNAGFEFEFAARPFRNKLMHLLNLLEDSDLPQKQAS
jgi:hypothetical protein